MKQPIIVDNISFPSVIALTSYTREIIKKIGVCNSIKNYDIQYFNFLYELFKRHPDYNIKIIDFKDITITNNFLNKNALETNFKNNNDKIIPISWMTSCRGKTKNKEHLFNDALREAITMQIIDYKNTHNNICNICSIESSNYDIDHEIDFKKIVLDFIKKYNITIPENYSRKDITNQAIFTDNDNYIKELFENYHKENSILRVLCKKCNLSRPKYKDYIIEF